MARPTNLSQTLAAAYGATAAPAHPPLSFQTRRRYGATAPSVVPGFYNSRWILGSTYGPGATPTSAAACDRSTVGAMPIPVPGGGRRIYLVGSELEQTLAVQCREVLYDRLLHCGGFDATSTGVQTVGGTITRHTDGVGNFIALEIYANVGTTPTDVTISYTNEDGDPETTVVVDAFAVGSRNPTQIRPVLLAAGDRGVRSVESVQLSVSAGLAGNFGVTIGHIVDVVSVSRQTGMMTSQDYTAGPNILPDVTDACLTFYSHAFGSWLPDTSGALYFLEA